ncbi:hypothetical protein F4813DRAFT_349696 [Daldinia decipiens]|uniref:uncharacterized protein n=1 Tax=Daldinia decipiens TaxID=326647 RepID=UPI0020C23FAF|nr:uncharacterized protein F4813DRAFT_349696 [Daldinia decipiens]KAI1660367.1 hypothetical protein F4813DRAFT_349696 [Daldinia decipiens]
MRDIQPPAAAYHVDPNRSASDQSIAGPSQPSRNDQQTHRVGRILSDNAIQKAERGYQAWTGTNNSSKELVLFVVKRGADYKLAQIGVSGLSCHDFFSEMRKEYFRLRGFLRNWSSIWRYSHCDFYQCKKFDDYWFVPIQKNMFPETTNKDYEYTPKPMKPIPPISKHEFFKRFYACHNPRPISHWYHECKMLGCSSYKILKLFPKKKTELNEAAESNEDFWGIYAREHISFLWVLGYNLICILPMLAFFVAWILPEGYGTDLQNPSMPFSMMLGMLSLFWSIFLSSLQFGKPR